MHPSVLKWTLMSVYFPAFLTTVRAATIVPSTTNLCDNCRIVNGIGYNPYNSDPTKYVQCEPQENGQFTVHVKCCPHGTFWNQDKLNCDWPSNVNSAIDRCKQSIYEYGSSCNCRGYWRCIDGLSYGFCCPENQTYVNGACVPSNSCSDSCGAPPAASCNLRPVHGDPNSYQEQVWSSWITRPCAPGSCFNFIQCQCDSQCTYIPPTLPACRAEVYLPFNGDVNDESGNGNFIDNEGVQVVNGQAVFDGSSIIRIPRFANVDFTTLVMRFSYLETVQQSGEVALVTNGDCGKPGTLYVARESAATSFGVTTLSGSQAELSIPDQSPGWRQVEYRFQGGFLTGTVDGVSIAYFTNDTIARSQCAIQIGHGTNFQNFIGKMDNVYFYLCSP